MLNLQTVRDTIEVIGEDIYRSDVKNILYFTFFVKGLGMSILMKNVKNSTFTYFEL